MSDNRYGNGNRQGNQPQRSSMGQRPPARREQNQNVYRPSTGNPGAKKRRQARKRRRVIAFSILFLVLALLITLITLGIKALVKKNPAQAGESGQSQSQSQGPGQDGSTQSLSSSLAVSDGGGDSSALSDGGDSASSNGDGSSDYTGFATESKEREDDPLDSPYFESEMPVLFNFENPIPKEFLDNLDLVSVGARPSSGEDQRMDAKAAEAFLDMKAAAEKEGLTLSPYSGFRSHERQKNNYNASINKYKDQGFSEEEAIRKTQQYYAIPGTSEHEAGLAIDINGTQDSFENTAEFKWLKENAADYGFIMRYAKDKTDITRVNYEPWHYRYVGSNHARLISSEGICLEEYVDIYSITKNN